jgi:intracellular multiplication protein IcmP
VERPLWYALHSLGFETEGIGRYLHPNPRVEALGARDHWAVEYAAGVPIIEPDLTRAMQTLRRHARARAPAPTLPRGARGKGAGSSEGARPGRQ